MVGNSSFDDKETYHPLFYLADPPKEVGHHLTLSRPPPSTDAFQYLDALQSLEPDAPWLAISSSAHSLTQLLSEIKSHLSESQPMPFLNSTVPEIYSFFDSHLRRPSDSKGSHHFTDFTFLAVDSECFRSPYTILVCSDAPDFHESETETRLKVLRLPLADAPAHWESVEFLLETPSEAGIAPPQDSDVAMPVVKVLPFPNWIPVEPYTNDRYQEYRIGTPAEARLKKKDGLAVAMAAGWELGKGPPDLEWITAPQY